MTTVRASTKAGAALLDQAAVAKLRKSDAACTAAGWTCYPFVADTFGALHAGARTLISALMARNAARFFPLTPAAAGRAIWSAVTAAAVARAAVQINRHRLLDSPAGINLQCLDHATTRQKFSIVQPLPHQDAPAAEVHTSPTHPQRPFPQCPTSQEESVPIFVVTLRGTTLVAEVALDATVETLRAVIWDKEAIPADDQCLTFSGKTLKNGRPLGDYGIRRNSTVHLTLRLLGAGPKTWTDTTLVSTCTKRLTAAGSTPSTPLTRPSMPPEAAMAWTPPAVPRGAGGHQG